MSFDNPAARALRIRAQGEDLRNRVVAPDDPLPGSGRACIACDGLLTVADRGSFCRQCVLTERLYPGRSA